jgi:hypothetical protein
VLIQSQVSVRNLSTLNTTVLSYAVSPQVAERVLSGSQARQVPFSTLPPNLPTPPWHDSLTSTMNQLDSKFNRFELKFDNLLTKMDAEKLVRKLETDTLAAKLRLDAKNSTGELFDKLDQMSAKMEAKTDAKIDAKFAELLVKLDNRPSNLAELAQVLKPSRSTVMALEICGYLTLYAVMGFGLFILTQVVQGKRYNWDKHI